MPSFRGFGLSLAITLKLLKLRWVVSKRKKTDWLPVILLIYCFFPLFFWESGNSEEDSEKCLW